jgi:hypothetical protein
MPQAAGNAVINFIHAAHTKYESNPLDWQRVVDIGSHLLTRKDMGRFKEMFFEDWLDMNKSWDGYIRIRDRLVLEGEMQEMNVEENFYDEEPYQARVCRFFLAYHQVVAYHQWLLFRPTELERYCKFEVSLRQVMYLACLFIFFVLMEQNFSIGRCIRQA